MTTTPAKQTWHLWRDAAHSAALNMAIDDALLQTAPARGVPLLRFYTWDVPSVSIGYVQRFDAAPPGYAIVRRPTGGGVVYHDTDFTYTVAIPAGHTLTGLDPLRSYGAVNRSVCRGLALCELDANLSVDEIPKSVDRQSMVCFSNPTRYDILLANRKVAGSAQRRTRDGILHQGSIHFGGPLPVPAERLAEALVRGFREELGITFDPFDPDAEFLRLAEDLADSRYATEAWNHRR